MEAVGLLLEVLEEAEQLLRHSQAGIIALSLAILLRRLSPVKKDMKKCLCTLQEKKQFVSVRCPVSGACVLSLVTSDQFPMSSVQCPVSSVQCPVTSV